MLTPLVVLWLGTQPGPALGQERAQLAAWAAAHDVALREPEAPEPIAYDARVVEAIEGLLEEARAAPTQAALLLAVERAEALLLAHPELPQASWLLAERYALEAGASTGAAAAGPVLLGRARALEGERASAAGAPAASADGTPPEPLVLRVAGARPRDRWVVDGMSREHEPRLAPGRHHLELWRGNERVLARWVELEATLADGISDPTRACSRLDLAGVGTRPDAPEPLPGVACPQWAVARRAPLGGTQLARCQGSSCGPWQSVAEPAQAAGSPAPGAAEGGRGWPAWVTWSLLGAGAVAATSLVLWQTGAFERDPPATEFVFSGPSAAAYRF